MMDIAQQILTTRGINSKVLVKGNLQRFMTEGHIGLFDFDGVQKRTVLDECMDLDGISMLWRSSNTGYHVWNLSVRSMDEIAIMGLKMGVDCKHVQHGYKMGKWVIRIAPKAHINGNDYKQTPKLLHTWCNTSTRFQSEAHFKVFQALTGKTIHQVDKYQWIGLSAELEAYMTITDRMKQGLK